MLQKVPIPDKIVEALLCDFNKVSHLATKREKGRGKRRNAR